MGGNSILKIVQYVWRSEVSGGVKRWQREESIYAEKFVV